MHNNSVIGKQAYNGFPKKTPEIHPQGVSQGKFKQA